MKARIWTAAVAAALTVACGGGGTTPAAPPLTVAVGGCCGDSTRCRSNLCADTLHCGSAQTPTSVYVCCANGSFCCTTDSDCQSYVPGAACNTATSTCHATCADDDTRCAAGFHCDGAACVADVTDGAGPCDEASDCASENCSAAFDPSATTSICAPAGTCASGNQSFAVGYTLCTGSAFLRRCDAAGRWSPPTHNPHPAAEACDAGGGPASGFHAAASCASGLDAADPGFASTCVTCAPFRATAAGCRTTCGGDDANCWSGYHCAAHGGDTCASDANGSSCDVDGECASGRCTAAFVCADKLATGGACAKGSDCTSGWCDGGACSALKAEHLACASDGECRSGHCSNAFDPASATSVCAPAGQCSNGAQGFAADHTLCSGNAYARRCQAGGTWATAIYKPTPAATCDAGGGAASGFADPVCTSGATPATSGFVSTTCHGCSPLRATATGCLAGCAGSDASCWPGFHCAEGAGNVCASPANGSPCDVDSECTSGRCDGTCMAKLASGGACDEHSDCDSGWCNAGVCSAKRDNHLACAADVECLSGHCSNAFDPASTARVCAPVVQGQPQCAAGGVGYDVGYTLCSGNAYARRCEAGGAWAAAVTKPTPAATCDAGGGAASGYVDPVCTSGATGATSGFATTTCRSCYPIRATASGCLASCGDADASCWPGLHCAQSAGGVCASSANGSSCDVDAECSSGRCDGTCMAKLANGGACDENSDCDSTWCNAGVCASKKGAGLPCAAAQECLSGICSAAADPAVATLYCTDPASGANQCWNGTGGMGTVAVGWEQCFGTGSATRTRRCTASGVWENWNAFYGGTCNDGVNGAGSGYYSVTGCTSGVTSTNPIALGCVSCAGALPNASYTGCQVCSGTNDAACISSRYCDGSACVALIATGYGCSRSRQCATGHCAGGVCSTLKADGEPCTSGSECATNFCSQSGYCMKGSCPFVFAWNGAGYAYENDVQGPTIGNARFASRVKLYGPHHIVLPGLQPDLVGDYRVKLREALPEIDFVDEVKLLVVDLPEGYELQSSSAEDTYRMGFVAPFSLSTAKDPVPPIAATDQTGADILAAVLEVDDVVAPAQGVNEPVYTFDFGTIADPANAKLIVDGWAVIGGAYGSTSSLTSFIDVVDASGAWVKARTLGFPSGDLKPMSISLAGLLRHPTDHRIRLHVGRAANSRWLVDRVRLDTSPPVQVDVVAELSPATATLRERGSLTYSASTWASRIHARDDTREAAQHGFGAFTRLGEVASLLAQQDDTYVVMRHGDELEMLFPGGLPAPAPGMQRAYVAKFSLYYKIFDESEWVEPMPFRAMSTYPYPATESFPSDPVHDVYRATFNTRVYYAP